MFVCACGPVGSSLHFAKFGFSSWRGQRISLIYSECWCAVMSNLGQSAWLCSKASWLLSASSLPIGMVGMMPPAALAFQALCKSLVIITKLLVKNVPQLLDHHFLFVVSSLEDAAHATIARTCGEYFHTTTFTRRAELDNFAHCLDRVAENHHLLVDCHDDCIPSSSRLVEELASLHRLSLHFRFCMDATFKDDAQIQDENLKDMSDLTIILSTWSSCLANRIESAEFDGENMVIRGTTLPPNVLVVDACPDVGDVGGTDC